MPAASDGALTRSDIEAWDTTHLETAATHWRSTAAHWESHFETIHNGMLRPGGTTWEGTAADAAAERSWADLVKVRGAGDALYAAAGHATTGAGDIAWAKRQVLDAIAEAEEAGFTVGQDFTVTDKSWSLLRSAADRQQQAQAFAAEISARVQALVAIDQQVATQITGALAPLESLSFPEDPGRGAPAVQAVDYHRFKQEPGPADPDVSHWPIAGATLIVDARVPNLPSERLFTAIAIPNPHLISFVDAVDDAELSAIGAVCEAAPAWLPNRANVSFVEVRGHDLFVRTFERGVGLTDSCGSAMAASTYAACLTRRIAFETPLTVFNAGGMVGAEAASDGMVTLSGNATFEWEGSAEIDMARGLAGDLVIDRWHNDEIAAWAGVIDRLTNMALFA